MYFHGKIYSKTLRIQLAIQSPVGCIGPHLDLSFEAFAMTLTRGDIACKPKHFTQIQHILILYTYLYTYLILFIYLIYDLNI